MSDLPEVELISNLVAAPNRRIVVARDGLGALKSTIDVLPDLVVCHDQLAGISGVEVCRQLKLRAPTVRTLLLSANVEAQAAKNVRCDAILALPLNVSELRRLLGEWGLAVAQALPAPVQAPPQNDGFESLNDLLPTASDLVGVEQEDGALVAQGKGQGLAVANTKRDMEPELPIMDGDDVDFAIVGENNDADDFDIVFEESA